MNLNKSTKNTNLTSRIKFVEQVPDRNIKVFSIIRYTAMAINVGRGVMDLNLVRLINLVRSVVI